MSAAIFRHEDGTFVPFEEVHSFAGDEPYVSGAIELLIGGAEVFSLAVWDDVNLLWPYITTDLGKRKRFGQGEGYPRIRL